jgi:PAS domain S-box-containing protein
MEINKVQSPLYIALEQVTAHYRRAQKTLSRLGKIVTDIHRRQREALRAREHEMRELLGTSLDAIVVANGDHRFVAANPKARELFGISETNIRKFNIEAFLPPGQIPDLDENSPPFLRRKEKRGACEIRRLNGAVYVAEYTLVVNFLPLRHLCRFRNIVTVSADLSRSASLMAEIASRRLSSTSDKDRF